MSPGKMRQRWKNERTRHMRLKRAVRRFLHDIYTDPLAAQESLGVLHMLTQRRAAENGSAHRD